MITIFGLAGMRDDIFDPKVVTLVLTGTQDTRIEDVSAAVVTGTSLGSFKGSMQGSRFVTDEVEAEIVARSGPDTPALAGIARVGLHWEFYNKRRG